MIGAADLAKRLETLAPIGRGPLGTTRLAWTGEDEATGEWFREQAAGAGLRVERDPAGNLWAVPDTPPPWWAVGSHLDSVREGGSYDGALGVVAAFEVAARAAGRSGAAAPGAAAPGVAAPGVAARAPAAPPLPSRSSPSPTRRALASTRPPSAAGRSRASST